MHFTASTISLVAALMASSASGMPTELFARGQVCGLAASASGYGASTPYSKPTAPTAEICMKLCKADSKCMSVGFGLAPYAKAPACELYPYAGAKVPSRQTNYIVFDKACSSSLVPVVAPSTAYPFGLTHAQQQQQGYTAPKHTPAPVKVYNAEKSHPAQPKGTPAPVYNAEKGHPAPPKGSPAPVHNADKGHPAPPKGTPAPVYNAEKGHPAPPKASSAPVYNAEKGHPAPSKGHPAPSKGHPAPSKGHPAPSKGHPAPPKGTPTPVYNAEKGHPAPPKGTPAPVYNAEKGHPAAPKGTPAPVYYAEKGHPAAPKVTSEPLKVYNAAVSNGYHAPKKCGFVPVGPANFSIQPMKKDSSIKSSHDCLALGKKTHGIKSVTFGKPSAYAPAECRLYSAPAAHLPSCARGAIFVAFDIGC